MRFSQSWFAIGAIVVMTLPSTVWARTSLEGRLERIENVINNQYNVDLLNQIEMLQQEVRDLRGLLDEQRYEIQALNQRQEKLYVDLDDRLNNLDPVADNAKSEQTSAVSELQTEKKKYDAAYQLLNNKQYDEALTEFGDFLWKYPDGQYAANAHYWMGEIHLAKWQQDRENQANINEAIQAFKTVHRKYQSHHKAVDALLKLGLIEIDRDHLEQAKQILTEVVEKYPDSSRARIAAAKLAKIN